MRCYLDSDVMIWHLRGEKKATRFIQGLTKIREYELWTGAIQRAEIVFFMRPEEERLTLSFLSQIKTAPLDQNAVDTGGSLFRKWNPDHNADINDCLLAAMVLQTGGRLYTLNTKHYPMKDISVNRAW